MWIAIPSSQWTLTTYSLPVSRRTPTVSGALYVGLTPRRFLSGEADYTGKISRCGDRLTGPRPFPKAAGSLARF
jgi:hypothetical protein